MNIKTLKVFETFRVYYWRGGQDSNLRSSYKPDNRLAGGPNQPLWHLPREFGLQVQRREWDSNPRGLAPNLFSRQAPSSTRSSLRAEGFYHNLADRNDQVSGYFPESPKCKRVLSGMQIQNQGFLTDRFERCSYNNYVVSFSIKEHSCSNLHPSRKKVARDWSNTA